MIASTPLFSDGLTKIEMDIIDYNKGVIDFEVACGFGFENDYGRKLKDQRIICHILPPKKHIFHYMKAIRKLIRFQRYDAVYIHGNSAMMFLEAIPAKLAGVRVITHCHNTKSDFPAVHYIMKPLFNLVVDQKIGCSELASKWAYSGKNIITIPNGVDIERFSFNLHRRETIRKKLGWEDKKIIGHIGRFKKQKNHKRLIEIFQEISKEDPDYRLLLIGDGELKKEIKQQIECAGLEKQTLQVDHVENPEDYLMAMDIVIMPSLYEGLCLCALEAQACGTPVLVSDVFTEETFVTPLCRRISLEQDNTYWGKEAQSWIHQNRRSAGKLFEEKGMSYSNMMSRIQSVLLAEKGTAGKRKC